MENEFDEVEFYNEEEILNETEETFQEEQTEPTIINYGISLTSEFETGYSDISEHVDIDTFRNAVSQFNINENSYIISKPSTGDEFVVPFEHIEHIKVIDGMIYNFSSETIQLATRTDDKDPDDMYYYVIEIPPYGTHEYFDHMIESGNYCNGIVVPYKQYRMQLMGEKFYKSQEYIISNEEFVVTNSPMFIWDTSTILLFILTIILVCKTVFRKG